MTNREFLNTLTDYEYAVRIHYIVTVITAEFYHYKPVEDVTIDEIDCALAEFLGREWIGAI